VIRKLPFACVLLLSAAAADAAERVETMLAVVSKGLPGVALYDADNDRLICQVKMDVAPHEAAFSKNGRQLAVPIYSSANLGQPGPDGHSINFVRTSDCAIEKTLDTGRHKRPHYIERGARSDNYYVTAEQSKSILVIDPKGPTIIDTLPTGSDQTHFFAISRDERRVYTSNVGDNSLSVLDVQGHEVLKQIDTSAPNQRMTLSPDNQWFVTSLWQSSKIGFYRTKDQELDFEIVLEGSPFVARFSADGKSLYNMGTPPKGSGPGGIRVWRIDMASRKVVSMTTEDLGTGTGSLQLHPGNGQVYLTAYSGKVSVLDPVTLKLLRQFDAPETPDGLVFSRVR
jgi:YVTN family beta-propeller protein